ncbi:uncharacterized protein ALTATR162_LOCUS9718 [Alternaria atra]|uniref:Uncharacterized protein n=1 Tax=Alternaria atra TaxID=119953 RepID=A0A8J2IEN9_9PLEO|nr:uncharacterized protein ALTATR162_LOCUS9718 [Alternaria atra]CAG5181350.1 unnamed protein product [Alternaria atra]
MFPRTTVAVIALLGTASALPSDVAPVHKRADKNTYDYVIVGGGITGLVAANRLSEDKKNVAAEFNMSWDPTAYGNGPLKLGISDFQYPDIKDYFKAFQGAGAKMQLDGNNGDAYGASWWANTYNPETGERSHARNSYYDPVSARSNLKVLLETLATELVFDSGEKLTAKGVKITCKKTNTTLPTLRCTFFLPSLKRLFLVCEGSRPTLILTGQFTNISNELIVAYVVYQQDGQFLLTT